MFIVSPLARRLRQARRNVVFARAWRSFARRPTDALAPGSSLLADLVFGWNNEAWSGSHEFLRECAERAMHARAPVLECGSGLSTLVLGAVVQDRGNTLWSLEHLPAWRSRVAIALRKAGITAAHVCDSPLQSHGEFDWYRLPAGLPSRFGLVICDGPPASTRGGRYGLLPVMRDRMTPDCVVLLDDAEREDEQEIARRWGAQLHCEPQFLGIDKPYFVLTAAGADAASVLTAG